MIIFDTFPTHRRNLNKQVKHVNAWKTDANSAKTSTRAVLTFVVKRKTNKYEQNCRFPMKRCKQEQS